MSQIGHQGGKAGRDDYIKREQDERRLGLTGDQLPLATEELELQLFMTRVEILHVARALATLDWTHGLTRDQIRLTHHDLPLGIYLRLPDSKRYFSVGEVLHEAGVASSRAEGDFMGANPDYPAEESFADGGPPGWSSEDPLYIVNAQIDSGSAEDSEGPLPGDTQESKPDS
jgi:hypothetical protein